MTLNPADFVGISFFVTSMALLAATVFFALERSDVHLNWRTSLTVATLVTGIAFVHYLYMRGIWIDLQKSPIIYRYIDWFITVPLQIIEFYLILKAVTQVRTWLFWRLLIASLLMLVFGYIGESGLADATVFFALGMLAWLDIVYQLFFGEVAETQGKANRQALNLAINGLKWIVTIGWAIYPLGYVVGVMLPVADIGALNIIYNLADFVNKIAFGLIIWTAAKIDTAYLNRRKMVQKRRSQD